MATYKEPLHKQPEFDDAGPVTGADLLFLRIISPIIALTHLVTMPARMRRTQRTPRGFLGRPASEQEWAELPAIAREYTDHAERTLSSLGFGTPRREITRTATSATAYAAHSFNPHTREIATVVCGVAPRRFVAMFAIFQTWWDDGSRTVTSNSEEAELGASLHRPPGVDALALPGLNDIGRLYAIHRRRTAGVARQPIAGDWGDPTNDPTALLHRSAAQWEQRMIESGLHEIESDTHLQLTWKGALLMTWSRLQPFRAYLSWRGRRRTAAALRGE
jgi:hypothetical protein